MKRLAFRLYLRSFRWWCRIRRSVPAVRFAALLSAGAAIGACVGAPIGHAVTGWAQASGHDWVLFTALPLLAAACCHAVYGLMVAWKYR